MLRIIPRHPVRRAIGGRALPTRSCTPNKHRDEHPQRHRAQPARRVETD
jgi:hypothetical protein